MKFDIAFLREALCDGSIVLPHTEVRLDDLSSLPENFLEFVPHECDVSIDTRTLKRGDLFVALSGSQVDGHEFLEEAVEYGASALLVQKSKISEFPESLLTRVLVIAVPDTERSLVALAHSWRRRFSYPVIGVTGSVGKTTTKEMLRSIFESAGVPACVSYKNQNTLLGLSINILRMSDRHRVAVFELGISEKHEMEPKADMLRPTIGVITTIAHAHMQDLGELPDIAKEKRKLFSFFKADNIGVVYGDHPLLNNISYPHPVVRFGVKTKNHVQARKISVDMENEFNPKINFSLKLYKEKKEVSLTTNHKGNVNNALAASAAAHLVGVGIEKIAKGLQNFKGFEKRFERRKIKKNRGTLISDCYNANPESMRAALMAVHEMDVDGEKIAVLGDMLELGEKELFWHRQVGRVLSKALSVKHVILVGERAKAIGKTAPLTTKVDYVTDWKQAAEKLEEKLHGKALVLVKASKDMHLHNLVEQLSV